MSSINYSEILDQISRKDGNQNKVRLPFPLFALKAGELAEGNFAFRVVTQDMASTVIEILDFKVNDSGAKGETVRPDIIPSPS